MDGVILGTDAVRVAVDKKVFIIAKSFSKVPPLAFNSHGVLLLEREDVFDCLEVKTDVSVLLHFRKKDNIMLNISKELVIS